MGMGVAEHRAFRKFGRYWRAMELLPWAVRILLLFRKNISALVFFDRLTHKGGSNKRKPIPKKS